MNNGSHSITRDEEVKLDILRRAISNVVEEHPDLIKEQADIKNENESTQNHQSISSSDSEDNIIEIPNIPNKENNQSKITSNADIDDIIPINLYETSPNFIYQPNINTFALFPFKKPENSNGQQPLENPSKKHQIHSSLKKESKPESIKSRQTYFHIDYKSLHFDGLPPGVKSTNISSFEKVYSEPEDTIIEDKTIYRHRKVDDLSMKEQADLLKKRTQHKLDHPPVFLNMNAFHTQKCIVDHKQNETNEFPLPEHQEIILPEFVPIDISEIISNSNNQLFQPFQNPANQVNQQQAKPLMQSQAPQQDTPITLSTLSQQTQPIIPNQQNQPIIPNQQTGPYNSKQPIPQTNWYLYSQLYQTSLQPKPRSNQQTKLPQQTNINQQTTSPQKTIPVINQTQTNQNTNQVINLYPTNGKTNSTINQVQSNQNQVEQYNNSANSARKTPQAIINTEQINQQPIQLAKTQPLPEPCIPTITNNSLPQHNNDKTKKHVSPSIKAKASLDKAYQYLDNQAMQLFGENGEYAKILEGKIHRNRQIFKESLPNMLIFQEKKDQS